MTPKTRKMRTRVCSGCGASKVIRADNRSEICRRCATKKQHDSKPSNLKHGFCGTNLWNVWMGMKYRCDASGSPDYPKYGGRGSKLIWVIRRRAIIYIGLITIRDIVLRIVFG